VTVSDVISRIQQQLQSNPVVLYMKGTPDFPQCGFSAAAVRALEACGAQFAHVNIFEDPEVREALKRYSNWPTYPQLYVNGELLGGSDIINEMYQTGELQQVLTEAGRRRPLSAASPCSAAESSGCGPEAPAPGAGREAPDFLRGAYRAPQLERQAFDAFASNASSSKNRRKSCRNRARFSKRARF
jgi:monothiol glutaredoxin